MRVLLNRLALTEFLDCWQHFLARVWAWARSIQVFRTSQICQASPAATEACWKQATTVSCWFSCMHVSQIWVSHQMDFAYAFGIAWKQASCAGRFDISRFAWCKVLMTLVTSKSTWAGMFGVTIINTVAEMAWDLVIMLVYINCCTIGGVSSHAALEAAKDYGIEYHVITLPVVVGQHESHITLRLMLWVQTAWTICFDNHKIFTSRRVWERETVNHQSKEKTEQYRSTTGSDVSVPFGLWRMALAGGCRLWRPLSWSLKGRHFSFLLCFV